MTALEVSASIRSVSQRGWLSRTPESFRSTLLAKCNWQRVEPGTALVHGGDESGGIGAIASGAINVISALGSADSPVLHIAAAPFWYGLNPVVANAPRVVTLVTRTHCEVASIPQLAVNAVMAANPNWWQLMAALALEQFALAGQIATDLAIHDSRRRCLSVLLRLGECRKTGDAPCDVPVGQDELASMANLSRQTSGAILRDLATSGVLGLGYRSITINRPAALRAIVDV